MCDKNIHDGLIDMNQSICPYCSQLLIKGNTESKPCCNDQRIESLNGINTCVECGEVDSYTTENDFIDFHANIHKIYKKSVYHRFYHIQNVLNKLCLENGIELSNNQRDRIYKMFNLIDTIIPEVNNTGRKRLISINYILKMLFNMMNLSCDNIPISKSKRTLSFYEKYWANIMNLISDKIKSIIDHKTEYICYPIGM